MARRVGMPLIVKERATEPAPAPIGFALPDVPDEDQADIDGLLIEQEQDAEQEPEIEPEPVKKAKKKA